MYILANICRDFYSFRYRIVHYFALADKIIHKPNLGFVFLPNVDQKYYAPVSIGKIYDDDIYFYVENVHVLRQFTSYYIPKVLFSSFPVSCQLTIKQRSVCVHAQWWIRFTSTVISNKFLNPQIDENII